MNIGIVAMMERGIAVINCKSGDNYENDSNSKL